MRKYWFMPLAWSITIYCSAAAFLVAGILAFRRARWLGLYLLVCCPLSVAWAILHGHVPYWTRPVSLALQVGAVIEAIALMHRNCWNPRRRYRLAGFLALCAVAGSFSVAEYPGFPRALWWAVLWTEIAAAASCGASLAVWRWWRSFQPAGWTIGNVAIMGIYCASEVAALLWPVNAPTWISIDVTLSLVQGCCLLWWIGLYRSNA